MVVTTSEIQNNFGKYLKLSENEEIIITKNGKAVSRLTKYSGTADHEIIHIDGKAQYWVVNPFLKEIYIYICTYKCDERAESKVFTGLGIEVSSIFI